MYRHRTLAFIIPVLAGLVLSCDYNEPVALSSGTLTIRTRTIGAEIDEDGYAIRLDGNTSLPIGHTADVTIVALEAGDHSLLLDGVASNCQVLGTNPRSVAVSTDLTTTIVLQVACTGSRGFLEISTATTGESKDSDGYEVAINARQAGTVGDDAGPLRIFTAAGTHEVALSGIASNCHVQGENPRQVALAPPAMARTTFQIVCLFPPRTKILFEKGYHEVWVMNRDGSSPQNLGYNLGSLLLPSWSPDGTRILFMTFREAGVPGHNIGAMSSIGTDYTVLLRGGELNTAAWSPNGQRIVFTRLTSSLGEPQGSQIWVMNANGSGETRLTNDILFSEDPAWSPDGAQIAFARDGRIFLMNADGSDQRVLTNPAAGERDEEARWSPDGTRLAFIRVTSARNLWTINPGGSDLRRLTTFEYTGDVFPGSIYGYSWAPDGERLTFSDFLDVYTVGDDASNPTNLTNSPAYVKFDPSWSPDGGSILYTAYVGPVTDIFVVDVNSHHVTNLTNGTGFDRIARALWQP